MKEVGGGQLALRNFFFLKIIYQALGRKKKKFKLRE